MSPHDPYHAHVYYDEASRPLAEALRQRLRQRLGDAPADLRYVGELRDRPVGPHPMPQFELHFDRSALDTVRPLLAQSGLRVLVHPLTLDDLADHTTLAEWIGEPLALDCTVLDPPGINQGFARYGHTDV